MPKRKQSKSQIQNYTIDTIINGESLSSVELTRTSKSINFRVKVYHQDIKTAKRDAENIFKDLETQYPV